MIRAMVERGRKSGTPARRMASRRSLPAIASPDRLPLLRKAGAHPPHRPLRGHLSPHAWGRGKASQRKQRKNDLAELVAVAANGQVPIQVFKSLHKVFDVRRMHCEAGFRGGDKKFATGDSSSRGEISQPPSYASWQQMEAQDQDCPQILRPCIAAAFPL